MTASRRRRTERGSVSLELIALIPVLALVMTLTFEVAATLYTVTATNQAVRAAARAESLDRDPAAAAAASLPGPLDDFSVGTGASGAVRLEVRVPGLAVLPDRTVTRELLIP